MHHVILGAGPAGVTAAETLRHARGGDEITLISGEEVPPYSRMAIPYLLHGNIKEQGTYLRQAPGHYEKLGIKVMHGRAGGIDTKGRRLFLAGGPEIAYDRLLVATGASPIMPQIDGANLPGVHSCWTLADAREIAAIIDKGAPVVLCGAGFIGSIILEAIHSRGADLTVVELAPRMVSRMMDETAGGMLKRWCEAKGVRVLTGQRVERITSVQGEGGGGPLRVQLSSGGTIPARLVVMAVGVRPNTGFLVGSGVSVGRGIGVDDHLRTSAPDVYAAGDCCEALDFSTGKPEMLAIQPTAVEHGRIAALNMAGMPTRHRGSLNMNVLDTMGLISSSFGLWQGGKGGGSAKQIDETGYRYMRLEFEGERLVGAQCVGHTENVGILRGLIQTGIKLGGWKGKLMRSPERVAEAYVATAQGMPGFGPGAPHTKMPVTA
jgi:NAD(P)H-nitrite reductase large subunit